MDGYSPNVRFVPKAEILRCGRDCVIRSPHRRGQGALFDIRAGAGENSAQCLIRLALAQNTAMSRVLLAVL
jgi:hypothetical protein